MTSDPPTTLLVRAANAVYAAETIDFQALRSELAEAVTALLATEESAAIVAEHPELAGADPVAAFAEVVDVLEANGPEAAGVLFSDVLGRFHGAFGRVVTRCIPLALFRGDQDGWDVFSVMNLVDAMAEDELAGYAPDVETTEKARRYAQYLADATDRPPGPSTERQRRMERALARALPGVIDLLLDAGPAAAQQRLQELAEPHAL
jgi:hypothetical protein